MIYSVEGGFAYANQAYDLVEYGIRRGDSIRHPDKMIERQTIESMTDGQEPGSYSYFVQQLENDFLQENLLILLEYGLPRSSVQKLAKFLPEALSEDEVLDYIIKNKSSIMNIFAPYEQERVTACIL